MPPVGRICPACRLIVYGGSCACGKDPGVGNRGIYDDPRWRSYTRPLVLERDRALHGGCVDCGDPEATHVDHIVPAETLVALGLDPFDPRECELRCARCHRIRDGTRLAGETRP